MSTAPRHHWLAPVARTACAMAFGITVFFTFGAAPALFAVYPRATAGEITGVLFPAYHHFLYAACGVALLALAVGRRGIRHATASLVLVALLLGCVAVVDLGVGPILDHLRGPANRAAFARWHGIAMLINLAGMAAIGVACFLPRAHVTRSQ